MGAAGGTGTAARGGGTYRRAISLEDTKAKKHAQMRCVLTGFYIYNATRHLLGYTGRCAVLQAGHIPFLYLFIQGPYSSTSSSITYAAN